MEIRFYQGLCSQARAIREAVFVQEQGFINEFDEIDAAALHMVIYDGETAVATGRVYRDAGGVYHIGRVAVVKEYRGKHLGNRVLLALEQKAAEMGAQSVALSAQCAARGFYEKNGYAAAGEVYLDEHCPHIHMEKQIGPKASGDLPCRRIISVFWPKDCLANRGKFWTALLPISSRMAEVPNKCIHTRMTICLLSSKARQKFVWESRKST